MATKHILINGDSRNLSLLPNESVQLIVTSPPYWQLKDYGVVGQIGFNPHTSPYYVVLHFDNSHPIQMNHMPNLKEDKNTYRAKIKKLSELVQQAL